MQLHQMAIPCVHAGFPTEADDQIDGNARHLFLLLQKQQTGSYVFLSYFRSVQHHDVSVEQSSFSLWLASIPSPWTTCCPHKGHRQKPGNQQPHRAIIGSMPATGLVLPRASTLVCRCLSGHSSYSILLGPGREAKYLLAGCLDLENQSWEDRSRPLAP